MYLRKHLQTFGQIDLTLNRLLDEFGYSTKSHNKLIYLDFRNIIQTEIIDKGYAVCDTDIITVSPTMMFSLQLVRNKSLFFTDDTYVQLTVAEYEKIVSSHCTINKSVLVGVYLFIKQYIMDESMSVANRISYPPKQQIKTGVGVSSNSTIEAAISNLVSIGLLYMRSDMFVENSEESNIYVPARNVYALENSSLIGDEVLNELEKVYGKKVYNKEDVPGKIQFLTKKGI